MGPETGSRTFDKLDFILFLLVLLLRVSLRILALARHLLCLFHCFYNYFLNQASICGVHHRVLPTISFITYLRIKFIMFLFYWMQSIWRILTDPKDVTSTRIKMKNVTSAGIIRPLWSSCPNSWCFKDTRSTVLMLICISTIMTRLWMPSHTQQDHHSHEFGILFVF
jgi:hypothetical protein